MWIGGILCIRSRNRVARGGASPTLRLQPQQPFGVAVGDLCFFGVGNGQRVDKFMCAVKALVGVVE